MSSPASPGSASERVYQWVRKRTLDGTFPGGRMLSEGEIADEMALSRTPVREAFLRLGAEGILQLYPKRGALVLSVTTDELRNVLVARAVIEPWAVRVIAGLVERGPLLAPLRVGATEVHRALESDDDARFQEADRSFHQRLVSAAGNDLLAAFYESLRDRQLRAGHLGVANDPERAEMIVSQHAGILHAVEIGDAEAAARVTVEHLNDSARALGFAALD